MCKQGRSTLAIGEDGRILDRLAGLEKVSFAELVRHVLHATDRMRQPQSNQSPRDQAQDVQMEQEATPPPAPTAIAQSL